MIVTVTPNTAIDYTLFVPSFELNKTLRTTQAVWGMAGKAADASWTLGELGIPSLATGFAAGYPGKRMIEMFHAKGVQTDFVWVDGETRINVLVVSEDGRGQSTLAVETLQANETHVDQLRAKYMGMLDQASTVILGGSLPGDLDPALYTELIGAARRRDIPVVFDAYFGPFLRAGLASHPTFIKPNRVELESLTGKPVSSLEDAYRAGMDVYRQYGTMVVATLGEEGALAVLGDRAYRIPPLKVKVVSTAGAGDAVLAGLAYALSEKKPLEDGLRLGTAAAAAVIMTPATADCRREDVEALLPKVELIPYSL
ncbi:MAG: 1-phosphofructokinase family hexose kinase [Chloroflexi bacterium]|nr:1-phosphofructokinase family hexose kinase [Chloroflexota bacterium]